MQTLRPERGPDLEPSQAVTKRAGRKKDSKAADQSSSGSGKPHVKKAVFESTKKKEVGVSDLTLISKISNEAINDNLKKRFENAEIYVSSRSEATSVCSGLTYMTDLYWPCAGLRQSIPRL